MAGLEQYRKLLDDRYAIFHRDFYRLLDAFITIVNDDLHHFVSETASSCYRLMELVPAADRPRWLNQLHSVLQKNQQIGQPSTSDIQDLHKALFRIGPQIEPIVFPVDDDAPSFDSAYDEAIEEFEIREVFDAAIEAISKIIDSGEIESKTIDEVLTWLLRKLKANRDGSFQSQKAAYYVYSFVWHSVVEALKLITPLKVGIAANEKALKNMREKFPKAEEKAKETINSMVLPLEKREKLKRHVDDLKRLALTDDRAKTESGVVLSESVESDRQATESPDAVEGQ